MSTMPDMRICEGVAKGCTDKGCDHYDSPHEADNHCRELCNLPGGIPGSRCVPVPEPVQPDSLRGELEALKAIEKAHGVVSKLCAGTIRWTMSVPADEENDPDLVITNALMMAQQALAKYPDAPAPGLRVALEAALELVRSIQGSHKASIGSIRNTYTPQLAVETVDVLAETLVATLSAHPTDAAQRRADFVAGADFAADQYEGNGQFEANWAQTEAARRFGGKP